MSTADASLPIIAVAAEAREFSGLLRHADRQSPLPLSLQFAREAIINGRRWLLVANGPGPRLAEAALRQALGLVHPAIVVSTGNCGALDAALREGDVFVATSVLEPDPATRFEAQVPPLEDHTAQGMLLSMDRVAVSAAEKQSLRSTGAMAIEMEAGAVARTASENGCRFFCIRGVSDIAGHSLPLDFNAYRDADGRFEIRRIAMAALLRPWKLAGLIGLARGARAASHNLGEFLARCPF